MKRTIRPALFAALALSASMVSLFAQTPGPGPQGPPPGHHGPPPSPLFDALDTNHDGVISADEIANASAALAKLAGSSGQITRDALRLPRPDAADNPHGPDRQARTADADPQSRSDRRPQGDRREAADDGTNPPPDGPPGRRHGPPPPDDRRPQDRTQASSEPAASPFSNASSGPDGQGPGRHHGPPHGGPLFDALDTNHDGVISADEIANAAASLKTLDKNGDGQLTREELRPPGPPPPAPRN